MKVTKIRNDVWKFKGEASVYLIKNDPLDSLNGGHPAGQAEWVLIDAGDAGDREDLIREIRKVVSLKKINIVLLTHLHYDHLGCLDLFPNAKVFASGVELQDYVENARGFNFYVSKEIDNILRNKAKRLKGSGWGLKILKVPGHTRGSVAFLDEKRKLLFSGDTIFGGGIMGRTDFPNSLPDEMDRNVRMLRKLVVSEGLGLCPGHGYWEDQQSA
jgi:glyoxylase-like metal-dependent hydrolase (beta-lactamase superfamily II)